MAFARTGRNLHRINRFEGGYQEWTSPLLTASNQLREVVNCDVTRAGIISKADGFGLLGAAGSINKTKGVGVFERESASHELLKLWGTALSKWTGSVWSSLSTAFTNNATDKAVFANAYVDDVERVYIVTGHNDNVFYYDGSSVSSIANTKAKAMAVYQNRIYLGNVKLTSTTYASRVIWSSEGTDLFNTSFDFFDDMSEPITALRVYSEYLMVFTQNKVARFDGYALRFLPVDFGTPSERSVVVARGRLFWYTRQGVYMYDGSSAPVLISRPIYSWINGVTSPTDVAGAVDSKGRYILYLGDITATPGSFSDVLAIYDPLDNNWSIEYNRPFGSMVTLKSGGNLLVYAGDVDYDRVWAVDSGTSDAGSAISSYFILPKLDLDIPDEKKNFYKVFVTHTPQNASEYLTVTYRLDGDSSFSAMQGTSNNVPLSGTQGMVVTELNLPPNTQGSMIQIKISHSSDTYSFFIYEVGVEYDIIKRR